MKAGLPFLLFSKKLHLDVSTEIGNLIKNYFTKRRKKKKQRRYYISKSIVSLVIKCKKILIIATQKLIQFSSVHNCKVIFSGFTVASSPLALAFKNRMQIKIKTKKFNQREISRLACTINKIAIKNYFFSNLIKNFSLNVVKTVSLRRVYRVRNFADPGWRKFKIRFYFGA